MKLSTGKQRTIELPRLSGDRRSRRTIHPLPRTKFAQRVRRFIAPCVREFSKHEVLLTSTFSMFVDSETIGIHDAYRAVIVMNGNPSIRRTMAPNFAVIEEPFKFFLPSALRSRRRLTSRSDMTRGFEPIRRKHRRPVREKKWIGSQTPVHQYSGFASRNGKLRTLFIHDAEVQVRLRRLPLAVAVVATRIGRDNDRYWARRERDRI